MKQPNRINRISCVTQADGSIDITIPASMAEDFKLMVKKGTNLSPDMHVEIRDFTDRILGRDKYVGSCMKEAIYGHQTYAEIKAEMDKLNIVSTHWDIPAEDKHDIATFQSEYQLKPEDKKRFKAMEKPYCKGHPETCNCPYHAG